MAVKTYRELIAWQRAMDFAEEVYRVTAHFPREERYGLTGQLRRAAVSVPSNIAEGQGRGVGDDFARFVRVAQGSLQEAETQIILGERLQLAPPPQLASLLQLADEVGRLNRGLYNAI